ncbi:PTS sugar transporter subunit IIC [Streptobacillus felis]|uniref:PTS sugar transporter subunit IIC n=1 Tax=Streptobacillus felis TaxID=1384509 RepID=A0A7Z0PGP2_9FUSO|nr:PTS sugar transporter subunit IIC [Streptobacillus felis]NYV28368.1 PTS sugar transporter subunit IIC [Streptobacillus felis]
MKDMNMKQFIMKVLNGTAIGIVVGLIPNAVLGGLFKYLAAYHPVFGTMAQVVADIQWLVAPMIGFLVGLQFGFNPMKSAIIMSATWIASGALVRVDGALKIGLGDLINVMLVAGIAAYITMLLGEKLGSLTIVLQPIIVGAGVGFLGLLMLPYVQKLSTAIGNGINSFTTLQPILMCILIAMSFSVLIVSPMSTVAIGIAIGLSGLASGAANIGVAATAAVLVIGSWKVNKAGVTIAVGMGGMKMMMPNLVRNPIMLLPILTTSTVAGLAVRILGITGDKISSGFGFVGLVGPIKAMSEYAATGITGATALIYVVIAYLIVPFGVALVSHIVYTKVLKIYKPEIYKFEN